MLVYTLLFFSWLGLILTWIQGLLEGAWLNLKDYLASEDGKRAKVEWDNMPEEEKEMYYEDIKKLHQEKRAVVHINPQTIAANMNNTFVNITAQVCDLYLYI